MKKNPKDIKEAYVKDRIKKVLNKYAKDCWWHMPVQAGYGAPGLDFHVCVGGKFLGIEAKRPGKHPTPRQDLTISDILTAGGHTIVIGEAYYVDEDMFSGEAELIAWLLLKP